MQEIFIAKQDTNAQADIADRVPWVRQAQQQGSIRLIDASIQSALNVSYTAVQTTTHKGSVQSLLYRDWKGGVRVTFQISNICSSLDFANQQFLWEPSSKDCSSLDFTNEQFL